jgi:uncharacterized protein (DUF2236 family)
MEDTPTDLSPGGMQIVLGEAILLLGGAYAILLQLANPGIARGVFKHSNFCQHPLHRLKITMTYMYCMAYGTASEKKEVIARVHKAHSTVKGPSYDADDERLQLWVAATLYFVGLEIYEKFFPKLNEKRADDVYEEYSILATALRVRPELWPSDRIAFKRYWDKTIEDLQISEDAKSLCQDLLHNRNAPLWMRACLSVVRVLTAEWMPSRLRDGYGLKRKTLYYHGFMIPAKLLYPLLPRKIRIRPVSFCMRSLNSAIPSGPVRERTSENVPISATEVSKHDRPDDIWMIINGKVFDLTDFQREHPGGSTVLQQVAGKDASKDFLKHHKSIELDRYRRLCVGFIETK